MKFDLEQNKSRGKFEVLPRLEFFTYGKVATQKLPESKTLGSPSKAAIKRFTEHQKKKTKA